MNRQVKRQRDWNEEVDFRDMVRHTERSKQTVMSH